MRICPACNHENLDGSDQCEACGISLTLEDTNPEYGLRSESKVQDSLKKAGLTQALCFSPRAPLDEVIAAMRKSDHGCILLVEGENLEGILTERDILRKVNREGIDLHELSTQAFMTPRPECLTQDDSISFALNKMAVGNFRQVPVKTETGFAVFSVRDALNYLF